MRFFRLGAHHQNGFRPTVAEIAADIKRRPPRWWYEIRDGKAYLVGRFKFFGIPAGQRVVFAIAPPGGIANFPALITNESEVTA